MASDNPFESRVFINRVKIENFASIHSCDVQLGPLSILVGPNAAGKSNFIRAVGFALSSDSLPDTVRMFGGMDALLHRRADGSTAESFTIQMSFIRINNDAFDGTRAEYSIEIGRDRSNHPLIIRETLEAEGDWHTASYNRISPHTIRTSSDVLAATTEPYIIGSLSAVPKASDLEDLISCAHFYDLDTTRLRDTDLSLPQNRSDALGESGDHLGHVLGRLANEYPGVKEMIDDYISMMIPNAISVDQKPQGDYSEVEARFKAGTLADDTSGVEVFGRASLSEGTLRLAGILAALNQWCVQQGHIKFMTIEEPEKALHPPKLGILFEVLDAASHMTQVLVTTQSPDLLDNKAAKPHHILVVENIDGETLIGPMDEVGRSLYEDKTLSLMDLLRYGSMRPALPRPENQSDGSESA